jgi:hypothetical protein
VLLLLVAYAFTLPLLLVAFINKLWLAILIDVISVQSFFALNEVARDLEVNPPPPSPPDHQGLVDQTSGQFHTTLIMIFCPL